MDKEIGEIIQDRINRLEREKRDLIQKNRTYKGMLQKQNKIIDAMAEALVVPADERLKHLYVGEELEKRKQQIREYFEKRV